MSTGNITLTNSPRDSMHTFCRSRRIYLASGVYTWAVFFNNAGPVEPGGTKFAYNFGLAAGNYTWSACIDPKDGQYVVYSELDPDGPYHTARLSGPAFFLPAQYYAPFSASSVLDLS